MVGVSSRVKAPFYFLVDDGFNNGSLRDLETAVFILGNRDKMHARVTVKKTDMRPNQYPSADA